MEDFEPFDPGCGDPALRENRKPFRARKVFSAWAFMYTKRWVSLSS